MSNKSNVVSFKPRVKFKSQAQRPALGNYITVQNRRIHGVYREAPETYTGVLYKVVTYDNEPVRDEPK